MPSQLAPRQPVELLRSIQRALSRGPQSAAQLAAAVGTSQATLARAAQAQSEAITRFKLRGQRALQYAALRQLPLGLSPRQQIYRFLNEGDIQPFAEVEFLAGGATLERAAGVMTLYEGLPPYMLFAAPSGFLGRQIAQTLVAQPTQAGAGARAFPASLRDWDDEHRIAYLFTQGLNLPGNLVFGEGSRNREQALKAARPVGAASKLAHYVEMASALKAGAFGSSAGGEQPKFLSFVQDTGHVIVKFARRGTRAAELLPLEHLALRALSSVGVPASATQVLAAGDYVFLEVARFDRQGANGRVGMLSAGSVDDEFFGRRDSWSEFAQRCEKAKYLAPESARHIDTMAAFSELIGNPDTHFENISLLIDEQGEYQCVAPAYDILPMRYASLGGGVDPDLVPIQPRLGTVGPRPDVWQLAAQAADVFWASVMLPPTEALAALVPAAMRELAAKNRRVTRTFVASLLR